MGVMRKDKIRNKYIRGTVKVEWLGMKMREGRLRCRGDVMRDQEYVRRKMIEMELLEKRKRGRPKRRFLDVVKIWGKLVQRRRTFKIGQFGER